MTRKNTAAANNATITNMSKASFGASAGSKNQRGPHARTEIAQANGGGSKKVSSRAVTIVGMIPSDHYPDELLVMRLVIPGHVRFKRGGF